MTLHPAVALSGVDAITLDFGNTLVPVNRDAFRGAVGRTAVAVADRLGLSGPAPFLAAWSAERERQFREDVPDFREVQLPQRARRVLASLRGMTVPGAHERWDDEAASALSDAVEIDMVVGAYADAFVAAITPPPEGRALLEHLDSRGFRVAILSNWPLATIVDRVAAAAGWLPFLDGIHVSERLGTIKPHPAIFGHAAAALGCEPGRILHVGDDWAADVVGAAGAGWRSAYLRDHQADTPLPVSAPDTNVIPDLELDWLADLPAHVVDPSP